MKKAIISLCVLVLSGCAHQTVHEWCSDESNVSHYRDYDQCYSERSARQAERRQYWAHAFDGMGKPSSVRNCITTYYNGIAQTNCF